MAEIIHESPYNEENLPQKAQIGIKMINKSGSLRFMNDLKNSTMPLGTLSINLNQKNNVNHIRHTSLTPEQSFTKVELSFIYILFSL